MSVYGLEIRYNNNAPLRCFSRERGGVSAHVYTVKGNQLQLDVMRKTDFRRLEYLIACLGPRRRVEFYVYEPSTYRETEYGAA